MGIIANVFRAADGMDCTLNGWSSRFKSVCVVNAEGPFEPSDDCPAVVIVRHHVYWCHALHAISVEDKRKGVWTMMGGNFLHSSDSRFHDLCAKLLLEGGVVLTGSGAHFGYGAVPIHDRIE